MTVPALAMEGITKRFGDVVANTNVDFTIQWGEIHGLLGENGAGKTTLMNILYGMVTPDAGEIRIDGRPVHIGNPRDAIAVGVGMVHQHFMLVPTMTIAENVVLGLRSKREPLLDMAAASSRIERLSSEFGLRLGPDELVANLSIGERQRLEVLKLMYRDVRLLVLDEPSSVVSPKEWEGMAQILTDLAAGGRAIVFITHKLRELFGIADGCTIMRDGEVVSTTRMTETNERDLAKAMVGREVILAVERKPREPGVEGLSLEGLGLTEVSGGRRLSDVDLTVRRGEILGIAGVDGNGQRELVQLVAGVRAPSEGRIRLGEETFDALTVEDARDARIAVITEDRHASGVVLDASVLQNLLLKVFDREEFSARGVLRMDHAREYCRHLVDLYDIRVPSLGVPLRKLSGGNQQKVVLARELHGNPRVLIAAQPTRGLDVAATRLVYEHLLAQRDKGCATILISADLDEVFRLSDRIAVIADGRIGDIVSAQDARLEEIGLMMAGEAAAPVDGR